METTQTQLETFNKIMSEHEFCNPTAKYDDASIGCLDEGDLITVDFSDGSTIIFEEREDALAFREYHRKRMVDGTFTQSEQIVDCLMSDVDEYEVNIRGLLEKLFDNESELKKEYVEWFKIN